MKVKKRSGELEDVSTDKILKRIEQQMYGLNRKFVEPMDVAKKVIEGLIDNVSTKELDNLAVETAAYLTSVHPDYSTLASRIALSNLYKETSSSFSVTVDLIFNNTQRLDSEFHKVVMKNSHLIDNKIDNDRDSIFDYFAFKTLEKSYLIKIDEKVVERPQYMWMRVAIGIWKSNLEEAFKTYDQMSQGDFTHATPTLFNSGSINPQMSSCFLIANKGDSLEGIMETCTDVARISAAAGGIGLHVHDVRANGSHIKKSGGTSKGLLPLLRTYNELAKYWDQGGNKRKGSFAIYLEPWHRDIEMFLDIRKNHGKEEMRARDLFNALWVPDLFMERVEANSKWTLFCPNEVLLSTGKSLSDVYGEDFKQLYLKCESIGIGNEILARDLWNHILDSQTETGGPFIAYKDAGNEKSNQKNIGVIKSSNLCVAPETDILTFSGYHKISDLENEEIEVWNGQQFSRTKVVKTGENQKLISINFSNGQSIDCTEYHKFYIKNELLIEEKRANQLIPNDKIIEFKTPDNKKYDNITVVSIKDNNRFDDTYCVNEPLEHKVIFNGILTGNCVEVFEVSTPEEQAVCNLASIALCKCIINGVFDFNKLQNITKQVTKNLNQVIEVNYYPTKETKKSNFNHRPIGIGVQGLADTFALLKIAFDSPEAKQLNKDIFETIYYAALTQSNQLAKDNMLASNDLSGAYYSFKGSPASKGILQFDMWNIVPTMYNWSSLKEEIIKYGLRNSLLIALMPTATTGQILGNNECFEPFNSNLSSRRTLAGEFIISNKHLIRDLEEIGLWDKKIKNKLLLENGSIQNIPEIPVELKERYKTAYEISQKVIIDMCADRGAFVCQSQSMNLFIPNVTNAKLTSMYFYGWKAGLKTGVYYLRTKAAVDAIKFTAEQEVKNAAETCSLDNPEGCEMCGA